MGINNKFALVSGEVVDVNAGRCMD